MATKYLTGFQNVSGISTSTFSISAIDTILPRCILIMQGFSKRGDAVEIYNHKNAAQKSKETGEQHKHPHPISVKLHFCIFAYIVLVEKNISRIFLNLFFYALAIYIQNDIVLVVQLLYLLIYWGR